jgi:hypothetical protein
MERELLRIEYEKTLAFLITMEVIYKEFTPQINILKKVLCENVIIIEKNNHLKNQ